MSQIKIILDEEMELVKNKCKNSAIDFLFVLDGSGNRNDDSKAGGFKIFNKNDGFGDQLHYFGHFNSLKLSKVA